MRLNIGCGPVQPVGWLNIDVDDRWANAPTDAPAGQFVLGGMDDATPIGGYAEGAVAHHVLSMIAWPDLDRSLRWVRDVLEVGGWFRVSVPDFPGAYQAALDGRLDWFPIADHIESTIDGKLVTYLTQCGATRSIFTGPHLEDLLRRAGFIGVRTVDAGVTMGPSWLAELDWLPDRSAESIYVEGHRP